MEKIEGAYTRIVHGKSGANAKIRGSIRRLNPTADVFDYGLISTEIYSKKSGITKDTLQIQDFDDNTDVFAEERKDNSVDDTDYADDDTDFTNRKINPANPATPLFSRSWD